MQGLNDEDLEAIQEKIKTEKGWADAQFESEFNKYKKILLDRLGMNEEDVPYEALLIQFATQLDVPLDEFRYIPEVETTPIAEINLETFKSTEEDPFGNKVNAIRGMITWIQKRYYNSKEVSVDDVGNQIENTVRRPYYIYYVKDKTGEIRGSIFTRGETAEDIESIMDEINVGDYVQIINVPVREKYEYNRETKTRISTGKPELGWWKTSAIDKLTEKEIDDSLPTFEEVFTADTFDDLLLGGYKIATITILEPPQIVTSRNGRKMMICMAMVGVGSTNKVQQVRILSECAEKLPDDIKLYSFRALIRYNELDQMIYVDKFISQVMKIDSYLDSKQSSAPTTTPKPRTRKRKVTESVVRNIIEKLECDEFTLDDVYDNLDEKYEDIDEDKLNELILKISNVKEIDSGVYEVIKNTVNESQIRESIFASISSVNDVGGLTSLIAFQLSINNEDVKNVIDKMVEEGILEFYENGNRVRTSSAQKTSTPSLPIMRNTKKNREEILEFLREKYSDEDIHIEDVNEALQADVSNIFNFLTRKGEIYKKKEGVYKLPSK